MADSLALKNVHFGYSRGIKVLNDVNVTIGGGVNLGVVGESGSGKSTIVKLLLGILAPASGDLLFNGKVFDPRDRSNRRNFRRNVQVVFQDPFSSLDPRQRIGKLLAEPLHSLEIVKDHSFNNQRASRAWVRAEVAQALDSVGLSDAIVNRYPHEFSGGQRQRIAIARAIICRPKILIADEPVSALDVTTRELILTLFLTLQKSLNLTIGVVSHDLSTIATLCDEAIVLESGKIVERGPVFTLLHSPKHPYTKKLLGSIPRLPV